MTNHADLFDTKGRLLRLAVAVLVAGVLGVLAFFVAEHLAKPEMLRPSVAHHDGKEGGYQFVYFMTALAAGVGLLATVAIQNRCAKR